MPALPELLARMPLAPLGPGTPMEEVRPILEADDETLFGGMTGRDAVRACRAGLWLAFGFLDESHAISQELLTPEGSYWHALMHRREPDAANSKYWFRKVGTHPVYPQIREEVMRRLVAVPASVSFLVAKPWDAAAFVDLCERSADEGSDCHDVCRQVQRVEWELLFDWCYGHPKG